MSPKPTESFCLKGNTLPLPCQAEKGFLREGCTCRAEAGLVFDICSESLWTVSLVFVSSLTTKCRRLVLLSLPLMSTSLSSVSSLLEARTAWAFLPCWLRWFPTASSVASRTLTKSSHSLSSHPCRRPRGSRGVGRPWPWCP